MTIRRGGALSLLLAVGLGVPATLHARRLRCAEPFMRSCLERLYRRFDGTSSCARDVSRYFSEGRVTDCWANGAYATVTGFDGTPGTVRVVDSRGRTVLDGTTSEGTLAGAIHVSYLRRRRPWDIRRTAAGAWTVTCGSGRMESYASTEVAASTGCGPLAECPLGSCPAPE